MKNFLEEIEEFINAFNIIHDLDLAIDTIRIDFQKQHKAYALNNLGVWKKITKSSQISLKLKKRLLTDEISNAYQLNNENIYFFGKKDTLTKKYRHAVMVIFGMKQYTSTPPQKKLVEQIVGILKNVSEVDICYDMKVPPNIGLLSSHFVVEPYKGSFYVNHTDILMIDKFVIYDKAIKNSLSYPLWRIEFKVSIPNIRYLAIPLHDIKEIIDLIRGTHG